MSVPIGQTRDIEPIKKFTETKIPFSGFYESMHHEKLEQMLGVSDDDFYMEKTEVCVDRRGRRGMGNRADA
jgi:hypothetical protein